MPEIAADLHLACSGLLPETGIQEFQSLGPDPIPPRACARAREAARYVNGRCARGYSSAPQNSRSTNSLSANSLSANSLFNREKFPVLREFRPTRRLLAASRCISEAESGKIKRLVLIFIRFARGHTRARAAVFQGQADR